MSIGQVKQLRYFWLMIEINGKRCADTSERTIKTTKVQVRKTKIDNKKKLQQKLSGQSLTQSTDQY